MSDQARSQQNANLANGSPPQGSEPINWHDCPQGAVGNVVSRVKSNRLQQRALKVTTIAGSAVAVVLLMVVSFWAMQDAPRPVQPQIQPRATSVRLNCREVQSQLDDYLAGKVNHDLEQRIDEHMKHCRGCRRRIPHDHPKANLVAWTGSDQGQVADYGSRLPLLPMAIAP